MLSKKNHYSIKGSQNEIIHSFLDLSTFGNLHPLIYKVEIQEKEGDHTTYKVFEKPFGYLPIRITYYAKVKKLTEDKIQYSIFGIPFTKGKIDYTFSKMEEDYKWEICFDLKLDSKLPGRTILLNKMIAAQNQLMQNLQESLNEV